MKKRIEMKKALPFLLLLFVCVSLPSKAQYTTAPKFISKFGLGFCLPDFASSASNELGSVIDYGVTDVPGLAPLEVPEYKGMYGFSVNYGLDYLLKNGIFFETGVGFTYLKLKNDFANDRLAYTYKGIRYAMDYGCNEKYSISYIQVPVLIGYDLDFDVSSSVRINAGVIAGIGVSAKCKLENGYSNYTTKNNGDASSVYSGSFDLYSGDYSISQTYMTGIQDTYEYKDKVAAPFKRFDLALSVGASYVIRSFEFGVAYNIGLSNIANDEYFSSTNRVGGCLFPGRVIRSEQGIYDYKHKVNILRFFVNYCL